MMPSTTTGKAMKMTVRTPLGELRAQAQEGALVFHVAQHEDPALTRNTVAFPGGQRAPPALYPGPVPRRPARRGGR